MEEDSTTPGSSSDSQHRQPSTSSPSQAQQTLSTSEPSLRFPRLQVNRQLAHWISNSNPDIMRFTTTPIDDTGLSESTYELISGTDSESQDGNYTESMGESVGSLDFRRPDDVHSLAGTEQEDDDSVIDEAESQHQPATASADTTDNITLVEKPESSESECESDDDARSRSSLEYTQQSLKAPSMNNSPDASNILERPDEAEKPRALWPFVQEEELMQVLDLAKKFLLPPVLLGTFLALLCSALVFYQTGAGISLPLRTTSTSAALTTSSLSSVPTSSISRSVPLLSKGVGLIPINDLASDDWLFGGVNPEVNFVPHATGEVLVRVSPSVKQRWLSKDCLVVATSRGTEQVQSTTLPVDQGFLVKFSKKETHGVVTLTVTTSCRPKVQKVVKVHFGKGIMEEAFEKTMNLAHGIGELAPAAAQEAERRLESAKRSLETVSGSLTHNVHSVSGKICKSVNAVFSDARQTLLKTNQEALKQATAYKQELTRAVDGYVQQASEHLPDVSQVQDRLQLGLLNAQVSAKLWWLKVTSREQEHGEYQRKAKTFLASKLADMETKFSVNKKPEPNTFLPWSRLLGRNKCQHTAGRGRRGNQKCVRMA